MSILEYNGGVVLAMAGKKCVAIASDKRFGSNYLTISMNFPKLYQATDKTFIGFSGLATDVQTLIEKFRFHINMYRMNEERDIEPNTLAHLVSSTLYERRFAPYFVEPIVAGLDKNNDPFICGMDLIGCTTMNYDFSATGTGEDQLYGICEPLWQPNLEPEELFEAISQAIMSATNRDCMSGWGAVVNNTRESDHAYAEDPHGLIGLLLVRQINAVRIETLHLYAKLLTDQSLADVSIRNIMTVAVRHREVFYDVVSSCGM
ncbi:1034_t:CDS:2, partial [Paraglomus occultum]